MKPRLSETFSNFASAGIREPGKVNEPWHLWLSLTAAVWIADIILGMIHTLTMKTSLIVAVSVVGFAALMFGIALFWGMFCKAGRGIGNE